MIEWIAIVILYIIVTTLTAMIYSLSQNIREVVRMVGKAATNPFDNPFEAGQRKRGKL